MARVRCTAALLAVLALSGLAVSGSASARVAAGPQQMHGFLLRSDEPVVHTFSRTPSFAWSPIRGARTYEFELSTSKNFSDNAEVWSTNGLTTPAVSIPISLPWITGKPYSLYAHVRAVTNRGPTAWSAPFGFNMRWPVVPAPQHPDYPGLLRWNAVPGATAYSVWIQDPVNVGVSKIFTTRANMADEREYYTFHSDAAWTGVVHWRVRAERQVVGSTDNGLPAVSFGPWSPVYTSVNPAIAGGPLRVLSTVSNVVSDSTTTRNHEVMPAFVYTGDTSIWGGTYSLYRVEVFTDQDCLNPVFYGAITGAPAYVPRELGPLALPKSVGDVTAAANAFLPDGLEPDSLTIDGNSVQTTEMNFGADGTLAKIDLWDNDWQGGGYYWTVMPINEVADQAISTSLALPALSGSNSITVANATGIAAGDPLLIGDTFPEHATVSAVAGNTITLASGLANDHNTGEQVQRPSGGVKYYDAELTQDACAAGRELTFGKTNDPAVTGQSSAPYASGLSPAGSLVSAKTKAPKFYGAPIVAWQPTLATDKYEVQWSNKLYPWTAAGDQQTFSTSMTLPLKPGTWYYRVRGLDSLLTGTKTGLSWSDPVKLVVTKPRFKIVKH
jgi:hypothetical protein